VTQETQGDGAAWEPSVSEPTGQSPLRHFKGRLVKIAKDDRTYEESGRTSRDIVFDFVELDVKDAIEVYVFETTQIRIRYADPSQSRGATAWAALSKSVRDLLGVGSPISGLVGKYQEWKWLPCTLRQQDRETKAWGDVPGEAWAILSVEGVESATAGGSAGPADARAKVVALADGKTEKQFNEAALTDPGLRPHSEIIEAITSRKLLPEMIEGGLLTKDTEGVYHKAEAK